MTQKTREAQRRGRLQRSRPCDGLKPYAIPDSVKFDSGPASYEAEIKPNGQTIEFTDAYQLKVQSAPRDAYADYKKCHETRANLTRQRIILTTVPAG